MWSCRHAFAASRRISPELCSIPSPPKEGGRREGQVPTGTRGLLRKRHTQKTAQQHTGVADHSAFPARWSDGLCRALPGAEFLLASLALRIGRCRLPGWARAHLRKRLDRSNDGQDHTVLPYAAHPASPRGFAGLWRRSSARGHGLTGTTRPARTISCRRCRVHRNPARVSNGSRTAPLRRAGLLRSMPQFRISVKWNIFARRG